MSIQVKLRRGTTSQHSTFTGSEGEVTVDTDKDVVVVHDGTTAGGHPMVKASSLATVATSGDYNDLINLPAAGSGTVTSVALSLPSIFDVSGSPVTTAGTLTGSLATQTTNKVFASPNGTTGTPTFRSLVAADIPTLNQNTTGTASNVTGTVAIANGGTGTTTAAAALTALGAYPSTNPNGYTNNTGTVTSVSLSLPSIFTVSGSPVSSSGTLTGTLASQTANTVWAAPNGIAGTPSFRALVATDIPTLNQNTTGTAANVTGIVAVANGGTGTATPTLVAGTNVTITGTWPNQTINASGGGGGGGLGTVTLVDTGSGLTGGPITTTGTISLATAYGDTVNPYASKTANYVLAAPTGASGVPTFRALAASDIPTLNQNTTGTSANVTGTVAIANGGTGQTTRQAAMDALAGAVTSGQYLRGNGTDVVMSAIQVADVPTLNQNTTGTAANVTGTVAISNGGTGQTTANASFNALAPSQTGQSGKYLTTDGTSTSWATVSGGGGGASSADIQEFTTVGSSTWAKPTGAQLVHVVVFSGGGGGGSGQRGAAGTFYGGGSGGGGGARLEQWFPASALSASETITVGAGGTGGASPTVAGAGIDGQSGGDSSFGSHLIASISSAFSNRGQGGGTATKNGGSGGFAVAEGVWTGAAILSANGGNSVVSSTAYNGTPGNRSNFRGGGGGSGGGQRTSPSTLGGNGGDGGKGGNLQFGVVDLNTGGGGAGAIWVGGTTTNGSNGADSPNTLYGGSGGGGGANGSGAVGGRGGDGGFPSGGGGGGGGTNLGSSLNSGAGGNGGNGYVRVTTYF